MYRNGFTTSVTLETKVEIFNTRQLFRSIWNSSVVSSSRFGCAGLANHLHRFAGTEGSNGKVRIGRSSESSRAGTTLLASIRVRPGRVDPSRSESIRVDPSRSESRRVDPSQAESIQVKDVSPAGSPGPRRRGRARLAARGRARPGAAAGARRPRRGGGRAAARRAEVGHPQGLREVAL